MLLDTFLAFSAFTKKPGNGIANTMIPAVESLIHGPIDDLYRDIYEHSTDTVANMSIQAVRRWQYLNTAIVFSDAIKVARVASRLVALLLLLLVAGGGCGAKRACSYGW
jgi:hypothetical protein